MRPALITYRRGTPIGEAVQRILEQSPLEGVEALYDDDITMASALSVDGGLAALMLNSIGLKVFSNITTVPLEACAPTSTGCTWPSTRSTPRPRPCSRSSTS